MAHICLIDDDQGIRDTLTRILRRLGHEVKPAGNGREGLDLVAKNKFQIVITDIIMPEVEGIEVVRSIRQSDPDMQVIAMSGGGRVGNTDFLKMARSLGANELVYKPVTKTQFMEALNKCLERIGEPISA